MRTYYNQRAGAQAPQVSLERAIKFVASAFVALETKGYFQETFGYRCVDEGDHSGEAGSDRAGYILRKTFLEDFWPLRQKIESIGDEITLFTIIEFLHDNISEPTESRRHNWDNCGIHAWKFDRAKGRARWRQDMNEILRHYREGFELDKDGCVQRLGADGVSDLLARTAPASLGEDDRQKVDKAIRDFRRGRSSRADRQAAVRELFDVMERYRQELKGWLPSKEDEAALFNIANNFSIRHHREGQKSDYDDSYFEWIFYTALATVYLIGDKLPAPAPPSSASGSFDDDIPF